MSTTFLFWPLPGAAFTSLAICANRIFLKSSCVRSLLLLMAAALAFLSSSGMPCSFSAWTRHRQNTDASKRKLVWSSQTYDMTAQQSQCYSQFPRCLHRTSGGHPPTLHLHRRHSYWRSPSHLAYNMKNVGPRQAAFWRHCTDIWTHWSKQVLTFILPFLLVCLLLQDFSSWDVVFSLQLSILFDFCFCWSLSRSPLDGKNIDGSFLNFTALNSVFI